MAAYPASATVIVGFPAAADHLVAMIALMTRRLARAIELSDTR